MTEDEEKQFYEYEKRLDEYLTAEYKKLLWEEKEYGRVERYRGV